jgi:initiation factor 1A
MSKVNSKKAANSKKRMVKAEKQMEYADADGQTYGVIERALGMCRFSIMCVDGKSRKGCVRGSIQRKTKVEITDVVIVSLRDFDDLTCDIIHKYDSKGAAQLRREGLVPEELVKNQVGNEDVDDGMLSFDFNDLEQKNENIFPSIEEEEFDVDDI